MAKFGYIFLSPHLNSRMEDESWMHQFGCTEIFVDAQIHERFRPKWKSLLSEISPGDEIVVAKLSNAFRGIRELGIFLDLCTACNIRLVSIHDKLDSHGELFPESSASDVLSIIGKMSGEIVNARSSSFPLKRISPKLLFRKFRFGAKVIREMDIVNMYNEGYSIYDIWKISGYKSRTSIFRVLRRNNVAPNRFRIE